MNCRRGVVPAAVIFCTRQKMHIHGFPVDVHLLTAICLDQYNGNYQDKLDFLKKLKIKGIPDKISTIDFTSNQYHRRYTHLGWDAKYTPVDKASWGIRKELQERTAKYDGFPRHSKDDTHPAQYRHFTWTVISLGVDHLHQKERHRFGGVFLFGQGLFRVWS